MQDRVLVAYATKHGATTEIAERIGRVLSQAGLPVDVCRVEQVTDLEPYRAVVLGSAVYIGRWRRQAAGFLKRHQHELGQRPVWLFSSGPTGEGDPQGILEGWQFPKNLQLVADRIAPRDITVFQGAIERDDLGLFERWAIEKVGAPTGDFRNYAEIESWARSIAAELTATAVTARRETYL